MGANAVGAVNIMDDDFYNGLYDYNMTHSQPLYLLQGTSVEDSVGDGSRDAYDEAFLDMLLEDGRTLVDIIHGRKDLPAVGIRKRRSLSEGHFSLGSRFPGGDHVVSGHHLLHR